MNRLLSYLLLLVVSIACGCGESKESVDPVAATESEGPSNVEMVGLMEAHYTSAILAHDSLVQGDLDGFRARLAEFDTRELPEGSPEQWKPFDEQLHAAAARAREVKELGAAASTMAAVALACGACHQSTPGGPVYPAPPVSEDDRQTKAEMRRHEWAVLMLWDGVTGPSEYAWGRGAEGLAETQIFGQADGSGDTDDSLLVREAALRRLGEEAMTTTALPDRARLYGRMLVTCGDCHQAVGVQIPGENMPPPPSP